MLIKLFLNSIIIGISYSLSKCIQYKHVWKLFEMVCLHHHTVIAFCHLDENEKFLKIFAYRGKTRVGIKPQFL